MKKRLCSFCLSLVLLLGLLPAAALAESEEVFAFAETAVTKTCGDEPFTITPNNVPANYIVSYKSSNTAVATVNADGEVTIVDAGTTTITATAALDPNEDPAATAAVSETPLTATYTLTVNPLETGSLAEKQASEVFVTDMSYGEDKWFSAITEITLQEGWSCSPNAVQWYPDASDASDTTRFSKFRPTEGADNSSTLYVKQANDETVYRVSLTYNYDVTDPCVEVVDQSHDEFPAGWPTNRVKLDLSDPAGSWDPSIATSGVKMDAIIVEDKSETRYPVYYEDDIPYFVTSKSGKYKICLEDNAGNFVARDVSVNVIPVSDPVPTPEPDPTPAPTPEPDPTPAPTVSLPAAPTVSVPVSGEGSSVRVDATIRGENAQVDRVDEKTVAQISDGLLPTPLTMDFSTLSKPIHEVTLPTESIDLIAETPNVTGLEIKLSTAALTLDSAALQAVSAAAGNSDKISLSVKNADIRDLSPAQQKTLADLSGTLILETGILADGTPLHDFGDGSVRVAFPYDSSSPYLTMWYVAEDGTKEAMPTRYRGGVLSFTTDHFSHYVLTEDEANYRHICPAADHRDVATDAWYHEGVDYVVENGIMGGYSDGSFRPAASTTRAQIATMLWRLSGKPVVNYLLRYEDVAAEQYYTEAVRWATAEGIMGGYGNGRFGTNDPVTRQQLAAILWRYAKYRGMDVSVGEDTNILSYNDVFDLSEYAIPAMQWACGSGIIMGKDVSGGGMVLLPKNHATRAQVAVMLMRFADCVR